MYLQSILVQLGTMYSVFNQGKRFVVRAESVRALRAMM
jgi:hypothetical protein